MKTILTLVLLVNSCLAAPTYIPDSDRSSKDANIVAIVRFSEIKETGVTKQLDAGREPVDRALFRQFTVTAKINTLVKGEIVGLIKLTLYRLPTYEECISDFGEEEGRKRWGALMRNSGYTDVFAKLPSDHGEYICYLSKSEDGICTPMHGDAQSGISFFRLVPASFPSVW